MKTRCEDEACRGNAPCPSCLKGLRAMLSTKDNKTLAKKLSLGDEAVRRAGKLADTLTVLRQENQEVLADNTRLRREVERLNEKLKRTTKGK